ncbi:Vps55 family protein [Ascoidea rubescens DSM 1968]|uniref:Late endosomal protein n=1 Tax=Ascoidea rubescens DSM 1968 TaxID=1344418 RepID=A0A1D2VDD2_9ASCO|nr:late endosomal protein [Ascoidea rubescens DSM 1968]ODV59520.1 late endosomal protein [Ascoidea rubescens DSM 1968]
MAKVNPLTKIISLSSILAVGFLFIVLAGAIFGNWLPIIIGAIFALSHIPLIVCKSLNSNGYIDDLSESSTYIIDFGRWLSSFLLISGFALSILLSHCHIITFSSMVLTIIGGLLIYGTVVYFTSFFDSNQSDEFEI